MAKKQEVKLGVKEVTPKVVEVTEQEKEYIRLNNYDEYKRRFLNK
jgi:hypothetical protein